MSPPGSPRLGDGGRAPQLGAGLRIVGGDEAGAVLVALAAGHARDDLAVDDDRSARVAVAEPVVGHHVIPDHLAGPRVQGDDVGVVGIEEDLVVVDGDGPRARAERIVGRPLEALAVLPDEVAGDRVEGLHDVERARQVHDPAVDDRRGLRQSGGHRPRPGQPELVNVVAVDLIERAVAPAVQRPAPVDPVGRVGVGEHRVGDRREVAVLRRHGAGAGGGNDDERQCAQPRHPGRRGRPPRLRAHRRPRFVNVFRTVAHVIGQPIRFAIITVFKPRFRRRRRCLATPACHWTVVQRLTTGADRRRLWLPRGGRAVRSFRRRGVSGRCGIRRGSDRGRPPDGRRAGRGSSTRGCRGAHTGAA